MILPQVIKLPERDWMTFVLRRHEQGFHDILKAICEQSEIEFSRLGKVVLPDDGISLRSRKKITLEEFLQIHQT